MAGVCFTDELARPLDALEALVAEAEGRVIVVAASEHPQQPGGGELVLGLPVAAQPGESVLEGTVIRSLEACPSDWSGGIWPSVAAATADVEELG